MKFLYCLCLRKIHLYGCVYSRADSGDSRDRVEVRGEMNGIMKKAKPGLAAPSLLAPPLLVLPDTKLGTAISNDEKEAAATEEEEKGGIAHITPSLLIKIIQFEFSPTWSCVSLTRSTTPSEWKLFRFDKMGLNSFQILLVDVTFYLQHM